MCCKFNIATKLSIVIVLLAGLLIGAFTYTNKRLAKNEISYDEAVSRIQSKEIKSVNIKAGNARLVFFSGGELSVFGLSEEQEEGIFNAVRDYNFENNQSHISISFSPKSLNSTDSPKISSPMDKIFQLIFILFFISPPLIVLLLFLIWRELKEKNRMK